MGKIILNVFFRLTYGPGDVGNKSVFGTIFIIISTIAHSFMTADSSSQEGHFAIIYPFGPI